MRRGQVAEAVDVEVDAAEQEVGFVVSLDELGNKSPSRSVGKAVYLHFVGRVLLTANIIFQFCLFTTILVYGQFVIAVESNLAVLVAEIVASGLLGVYGVYLSIQYVIDQRRKLLP